LSSTGKIKLAVAQFTHPSTGTKQFSKVVSLVFESYLMQSITTSRIIELIRFTSWIVMIIIGITLVTSPSSTSS
jgi:hypothetical protein